MSFYNNNIYFEKTVEYKVSKKRLTQLNRSLNKNL